MDLDTAEVALAVAGLSLLWQVGSWLGEHRTRVRVTLSEAEVELLEESLAVTVVARNLGRSEQSIERVVLEFEESKGSGGTKVVHTVDPPAPLPARHPYRWTWDLGEQRYRVGRRHRAVVVLGSGKEVESPWETFGTEALVVAGLTDSVLPPLSDDEIEKARRRLFPSSHREPQEGAGAPGRQQP